MSRDRDKRSDGWCLVGYSHQTVWQPVSQSIGPEENTFHWPKRIVVLVAVEALGEAVATLFKQLGS